MRKFEKISFEQFKKEFNDDKTLYEEYQLPVRKTINSAGYDFMAVDDFVIKSGEKVKVPTGVKVCLNAREVLLIICRSSVGFKHNVNLPNQMGVIDADYYNNPNNEGHIFVALQNNSENDFYVKKGEAFAQGIIVRYETVDDEEEITNTRTDGFGSTN